jgi:hypothetical protein
MATAYPFYQLVLMATRECRKLYNEELHDLYSSKNIVRVIKSRIMKWQDI